MSDYIKREDAVRRIAVLMAAEAESDGCEDQPMDTYIEYASEDLADIPSADVVPVVRCKDCRHAVDYYHEGDCYCSNPKWGLNYFGGSWEFYCSDAERRNNE